MGRAQRRRERAQRARLEGMRERYADPRDALGSTLSLQHLAASGITPSGDVERIGLEAQMVMTPGWRGGRLLRVLLVGVLLIVLALVGLAAVTSLTSGPTPPPDDASTSGP